MLIYMLGPSPSYMLDGAIILVNLGFLMRMWGVVAYHRPFPWTMLCELWYIWFKANVVEERECISVLSDS